MKQRYTATKKHEGRGMSIISFTDYAASLLCILTLNTVPTRSGFMLSRQGLFRILCCALMLMLATVRMVSRRGKMHESTPLWLLPVMFSFSISLVPSADIISALRGYLPFITSIVFISTICTLDELRDFLSRFVTIVAVMAVVSFFFFLMGGMWGFVHPSGQVYMDWGIPRYVNTYHRLHYETQYISIFGYEGLRNTGLFCEGPMYNYVLCVALGVNSMILKNRTWISALLIAMILSTFSTTGYVVILLIAGYVFFIAKPKSRFIAALRIIAIPVIVALTAVFISVVFSEKLSTNSYGVRYDHTFACLRLFATTFPWGCGFGNNDFIYNTFVYDQGVSTGIPYYLAEAGFGGIITSIVPFVYGMIASLKCRDYRFMVFVIEILWLLTVTSVVNGLLLPWLFVALIIHYPQLVHNEAVRETLPTYAAQVL